MLNLAQPQFQPPGRIFPVPIDGRRGSALLQPSLTRAIKSEPQLMKTDPQPLRRKTIVVPPSPQQPPQFIKQRTTFVPVNSHMMPFGKRMTLVKGSNAMKMVDDKQHQKYVSSVFDNHDESQK